MAIVKTNDGMLAGVCSRLASRLDWNVWAIRAVLLILLVAEPLWTAVGYAIAAFAISAMERRGKSTAAPAAASLESPELAGRKQRINELEQRFQKWEQSLKRDSE